MRDYFCGWYFKCQNDTGTLAFIPAFHVKDHERTCSLQVITQDENWNLDFDCADLRIGKRGLQVRLGDSVFTESGMAVDVRTEGLEVYGKVRFGPLRPLKYDIMGPFCFVPFMECRHSVYSMEHSVEGRICVNGREYGFEQRRGYIEGDRGHSFPKSYVWSQCHFSEGSLMLSVADIPLGCVNFTGVIAVVVYRGKEYRLATYLGAKAVISGPGEVCIRQSGAVLRARLLERAKRPLLAPEGGAMTRIIHESPECRAVYSFWVDGRTLFSFESCRAAFEYEQ